MKCLHHKHRVKIRRKQFFSRKNAYFIDEIHKNEVLQVFNMGFIRIFCVFLIDQKLIVIDQ